MKACVLDFGKGMKREDSRRSVCYLNGMSAAECELCARLCGFML